MRVPRILLSLAIGALLLLLAPIAVATRSSATLNLPGNMLVEASSSSGALVSYTATADLDGAPLQIDCDVPPGSSALGTLTVTDAPFPLGPPTPVNCQASDEDANVLASGSFDVTVQDTTPPTVTPPADVSVETTDSGGKTVDYGAATATDTVDGSLTPSCSPASGSLFTVGATTVTCSATDSHTNTGSATFTVNVTLVDTTNPVVTVPPDITEQTTDPAGKAVTFAATATDNLDGTLTPTCVPASGSTFPVGVTNVTCSATDAHGNTGSASFNVTIALTDTAAPTFANVPGTIKREADGAAGSNVSYTAPTATDAQDGPTAVSCVPLSGSKFPLGKTNVVCTATDSHGNSATATFAVIVIDTTPPVLTAPADLRVYATSAAGIRSDDPIVAAFLNGATAQDIVDSTPIVASNAPSNFPIGKTTVTFTATDDSGNAATATAIVEVLQPPPGGAPPLPPQAADRTPPEDVTLLTAKARSRLVNLSWRSPTAADFDHVTVTRTAVGTGEQAIVYTGAATTYADRSVVNNVEYRYVVVSFDHAGNRSAGAAVTAIPKVLLLLAPPDGARVKKPPILLWAKSGGASYYNVQLFVGMKKVLSAWPRKNKLALKKRWKFAGKRRSLAPGLYTWYVWPGFGQRAAVRYGELLGSSTFRVT